MGGVGECGRSARRGSGYGVGGQPSPRRGGGRGRWQQSGGGWEETGATPRRADGAGWGGRAPRGGNSAAPRRRGLAPDARARRAEAPGRRDPGGELEASPTVAAAGPAVRRQRCLLLSPTPLQPLKWFPETPDRGGCGRAPSSRLAPALGKRAALTAGSGGRGTPAPLSLRDPAGPGAGWGMVGRFGGEGEKVVHLSLTPLNFLALEPANFLCPHPYPEGV